MRRSRAEVLLGADRAQIFEHIIVQLCGRHGTAAALGRLCQGAQRCCGAGNHQCARYHAGIRIAGPVDKSRRGWLAPEHAPRPRNSGGQFDNGRSSDRTNRIAKQGPGGSGSLRTG